MIEDSVWMADEASLVAFGARLAGALEPGLVIELSWPRWTPEIKEFFVAFGAVTIGAASVVIAPLLDTILASYLATGSRTAARTSALASSAWSVFLGKS